MSLNTEEKKAVVAEVSAQLKEAQTVVVAEYRGITVGELTKLRSQARQAEVYLRVLKNTLVRRAVEDTEFSQLKDQLVGPLIYSVSADPIAAAKVLYSFSKTNDLMVIKAGCYAGNLLNAEEVKALANIPSREELLAKLLGVMQAPLTGFVGNLSALAKKRESESA